MLNSRRGLPARKRTPGTNGKSPAVEFNFGLVKIASALPQSRSSPSGSWQKLFYFQLKFWLSKRVKNFLPETLTLPLPLAQSVSKPKLSHSVKFYQSHFHKEKTGKKESFTEHASEGKKQGQPVPLKIKQILPAVYKPLLFYCGLASAELAYLCFAFLRFWFPGLAHRECGYLAKPEVHNASYRQPKHTHHKTAEK